MKKRKPPIMLISVLVICGIGIVLMSMQNQQPVHDEGNATTAPVVTDEAKAIAQKNKAARPRGAEPDADGGPRGTVKKGESVKVNSAESMKQRPTESSMIGQWYKDSAPKKLGN